MCSQFIPKNKNIVYTEDKYGNRKDYDSIGGIAEGFATYCINKWR